VGISVFGRKPMPIYEYTCLACGVRFDRLQHFGDPAPATCPNGHEQVQRVFSEPAIIFKGSGFYATDHGRNGRRRPSDKKKDSKEPASEAKTDPGNE
jgi:putative FmdB family regulatory protein